MGGNCQKKRGDQSRDSISKKPENDGEKKQEKLNPTTLQRGGTGEKVYWE